MELYIAIEKAEIYLRFNLTVRMYHSVELLLIDIEYRRVSSYHYPPGWSNHLDGIVLKRQHSPLFPKVVMSGTSNSYPVQL